MNCDGSQLEASSAARLSRHDVSRPITAGSDIKLCPIMVGMDLDDAPGIPTKISYDPFDRQKHSYMGSDQALAQDAVNNCNIKTILSHVVDTDNDSSCSSVSSSRNSHPIFKRFDRPLSWTSPTRCTAPYFIPS